MAISRLLVTIFKFSIIAAWQISVTNGSYTHSSPRFVIIQLEDGYIFLVNLKIYIRAKMGFSSFQNLFQETLELSKSMVNLTNPWCNSKSMKNPWPCWRCRPKTQKSHPKGGCVEPSWHVRRRGNLNKTQNQSNSRPQNGQIMRKRNEPKIAHFPNTSISIGILENWKVSLSTLSNFSIFWEIP